MTKEHWERVYKNSPSERLGWYESRPESSLKLIEHCKLKKDAAILNVGAGASKLVDELIALGQQNIIANDISPMALETLKLRLGPEQRSKVRWVVDDLGSPVDLLRIGKIDLWHDRAVLHFFTEKVKQDAYFNLLRKLVRVNGYVIIAAFNLNGALKCSGLPVLRYDADMLANKLGKDFRPKESFDHTYTQPSGDNREYVYALFQRIS